jgi:hypothetical protein
VTEPTTEELLETVRGAFSYYSTADEALATLIARLEAESRLQERLEAAKREVERLRATIDQREVGYREQLAEVERLREALERSRYPMRSLDVALDATVKRGQLTQAEAAERDAMAWKNNAIELQREVNRLREALREIADVDAHGEFPPADVLRAVARAALAESDG